MTYQEVLAAAMRQSAYDLGCEPEDFLAAENKIVRSVKNPRAHVYVELPFFCNLVSYGTNIVASVDARVERFAAEYLSGVPVQACFETPRLHLLTDEFKKYGVLPRYMAEYFLPDPARVRALPCAYETRVLIQADFAELYTPEWGNALCEKRKHLDVLGVGAYDEGKLIGLAGCSADCETMWQIGVDILPAYRQKGVAAALTSRLAAEVFERGKIPYYCAAWSNIRSVRNALKSGFLPTWVELTSKAEPQD